MSLLAAPAALAVDDLTVRYGDRVALRDVSFSARPGELIACIGPNGAGKSSLFRAIIGLVPHEGTVGLSGGTAHGRRERLGAAYVPQRNELDLSFPVSVGEVVAMGRRRRTRWTRRNDPLVTDALTRVDLAGCAHRPISALSGGEFQRTLLARALAQEAEVLLLDESLSGVDQPRTQVMLDLLRRLARDGATVLVSTHDLALARTRFDRVLALNGRLVADGAPDACLDPSTLDAVFGSRGTP